ncbi:hypothetical protein [Virgibacillus sediminis]|uniref:MarR family transcriptional regulator n=1 Tax=Virgibacillus sediminis TaxID=202260 RepID=A0ABV7A3J5_9BACI
MANYLEAAKHYKLTLMEVSILVQLDKNYPKAVTIDQLGGHETIRWNIKRSMEKLKWKELVEESPDGYLRKRKID